MVARVGVLISGRGSNMLALIEAAAAPGFPAEIAVVLSNRPDAPGLAAARARGACAVCVDHRDFGDRGAHESALTAQLEAAGADIVCLAGYMRVLTPGFVARYRGRMLNVHPSLLPAFAGLHTHERALAAGVRLHGCTVHVVTDELDCGPILAQAAVPVLPGDTADTLGARVLRQEHVLYPTALAAFAGGREAAFAGAGAALVNPLPVWGGPRG